MTAGGDHSSTKSDAESSFDAIGGSRTRAIDPFFGMYSRDSFLYVAETSTKVLISELGC